MRFSKSLTLPIAVVALLGGCKSDSESSKVAPPAALPTASGTGTVTTATSTTVAAGATTLTVPSDTSASLLALSGGAPVTVAFSQNDTSKEPATLQSALGPVGSGNVATATWVINAAKVGGSEVPASSSEGGDKAGTAMASAAATFSFQISASGGSGLVYRGVVSLNGGLTWSPVTVVKGNNVVVVTGTAPGLPVIIGVQEYWSSTGAQ